jgi:hypothetical protein
MIVEDTKKPVPIGAGLRIHGECTIGHRTTWESCEFANKVGFNLHNYLLDKDKKIKIKILKKLKSSRNQFFYIISW